MIIHNTQRTGFGIAEKTVRTVAGPRAFRAGGIFICPQSHRFHCTQKERRDVIDDVDAVEAASAQIDQFIERRARERSDANKVEEFWQEQERCHRERRREANRKLWIDYYGSMHRVHLGIAEGHARRRAQLMVEGGFEPDEALAGDLPDNGRKEENG